MVRSSRHVIVPIFLPHLGCDRKCIYCNQSIITGKSDGDDVAGQIKTILAGRTEPVELALYSGNFFGLSEQEILHLLHILKPYRPLIESIRISTKPAPVDEGVVKSLKDAGVRVIELGMPSFNDRILSILDRGYTTDQFYASYRLLRREGFTLGLQVMVGLPGETEDDLESMANNLAALRPSLLRIYPLLVLKGTRLHEIYKNGDFLPIDQQEAIRRTALLYLHALRRDITVIRMGLSAGEVLQENIVAGPYHPSFGSLVKAHVFFEALKRSWQTLGCPRIIKVTLNSRDTPHLVGYKRCHLDYFRDLAVTLSWEKGNYRQGYFSIESEAGRIEADIKN